MTLACAERRRVVRSKWDAARQTQTIKGAVFAVLCRMAGRPKRCMYCENSRGTDIDHFWPKAVYPEKAFDWENLLLSCTGCGRIKGIRFPLADGLALLIDPTAEDPWDFLVFISSTGVITPRFDPSTAQEVPKGRATIDVLPVNDEAVSEDRKIVFRTLVRAVTEFLRSAALQPDGGARELGILEQSILDNLRYGLAEWYFVRDGQEEEPFRTLGRVHPEAFAHISQRVARRTSEDVNS